MLPFFTVVKSWFSRFLICMFIRVGRLIRAHDWVGNFKITGYQLGSASRSYLSPSSVFRVHRGHVNGSPFIIYACILLISSAMFLLEMKTSVVSLEDRSSTAIILYELVGISIVPNHRNTTSFSLSDCIPICSFPH